MDVVPLFLARACLKLSHNMYVIVILYVYEYIYICILCIYYISSTRYLMWPRFSTVRGSPAHTLWSHKYTQAQFCIIFSTQSHLRTQTGVTCAHSHFPESPAHTDWSHKYTQPQFLHHFFHPESPAIGWGGVGWGGDDDIILHLHTCSKRCAMDCFGTYFTHVQTCNVTRVQSATEWTASVHTLHTSKPVL